MREVVERQDARARGGLEEIFGAGESVTEPAPLAQMPGMEHAADFAAGRI